ncbi:MAG TPA: DUF2889 domain-containing protein [Acidimicrobiales bacterium]|nr:DUF2889 domain-containing protein [Acidimicrobiales bacterium]
MNVPAGGGVYRRRIRVTAGDGEAGAEMEDDFHHFAVRLVHDGSRVTGIEGRAIRAPWTTCVEAIDLLHRLDDLGLGTPATEVNRLGGPTTGCTHLVDLAVLAFGAAGRRPDASGPPAPVVEYDIGVTEPVDGPHLATLALDGRPHLRWDLDGDRVLSPRPYRGLSLLEPGFGRWATETLAPADIEPATVLRRACQISRGRQRNLDDYATAADLPPRSRCYSQQPSMASVAVRIRGASRDFSTRPGDLLDGPD